jgi:RTX calcium-binding nonapeptide repeat (4 copies)
VVCEQEEMDMRVALISLAVSAAIAGALVTAALAPPASAQSLSEGCQAANSPDYEGFYVAGWILRKPFGAGERLAASASPPTDPGTPTTVALRVNGVIVDTAAFPGTVEYVFMTAGAYWAEWDVDDAGPSAMWTVSCTRQAPFPQGSATCADRVATVVGTAGADRITGTGGSDVIVGGRGNDRIGGGGGNDLICAGPGNDRVAGGAGNDRLFGGAGNDRFTGGPGADSGADKVNFLNIDGPDFRCHGGTGTPDNSDSFAIIKRNGDGTISAQVQLKDAQPNTTYSVWLVERVADQCGADIVSMRTNNQGNASKHIESPPGENIDGASVFVDARPPGSRDLRQTPELTFGP